MTSRPLLDPELAPLLDIFPTADLNAEVLPQRRQQFLEQIKMQPDTADDLRIIRQEHHVPGPADAPPVRVLVYSPAGAGQDRPALLHVHGGGYVLAQPEMNDMRNTALASALECVIVSVDYRLAPETPFPGAVEDCYAALRWLQKQASALGVDPARIALIGESAGGGLAASLALLARDRGEVKPCFQMLIYPMLDDRTASTRAASPLAGEFFWTSASNRFGWSSLLGREPGGPDTSPYAAAARAANLAGLPPCFIGVGTLDLFVDENIEYARRLITSGVTTELHVYPGAFHGFDMMADAHVSRMFTRDVETALRRALYAASG